MRKARNPSTTIHALGNARVAAEATDGLLIASEIEEEGKQKKLAELRRFREGLAISTLFIFGVVLTLYFYICQNGRSGSTEP